MIAQIGIALGTGIVVMVAVGTVVKGFLGLRSAINWLVQTAVLAALATAVGFTTVQTAIVVALPAVIHLLVWVLTKFIEWKAKSGRYGEEAKWAYELFEAGDEQFIHAQAALPKHEVMEVQVIADSKDEFRDLMVERYNELAQNA